MRRVFENIDPPGHRWVFGEGTTYPEGDYFSPGRGPSIAYVSLEYLERNLKSPDCNVREICLDPALVVDEGL